MQTDMTQAAATIEHTILTPTPAERQRPKADLERLRTKEVARIRGQYDEAVESARTAYETANDAQDELYAAFKALAREEGRLTAAEYQARYEELTRTQTEIERDRARARADLVRVGERLDELDEDPDSVIDDFYAKYPALPHPARQLAW